MSKGTVHLFGRKKAETGSYDPDIQKPVIKCSICNGEQVAGFVDLRSGIFSDVSLLRSNEDLRKFKELYGITQEIEKIY